jgi:hypothetical protein
MPLTVRRENPPVRCEICHQTDLFNPETGNCDRCTPVLAAPVNPLNPPENVFKAARKRISTWTAILVAAGGLPAIAVLLMTERQQLVPFMFLPSLIVFLFVVFKNYRCPVCLRFFPIDTQDRKRLHFCQWCGVRLIREGEDD